MLTYKKTYNVIKIALMVMVVVSLMLATAIFMAPTPAMAAPDAIICTCCQNYWGCIDYSSDYLCHNNTWYSCNNVQICYDGCCTQFLGLWALVGYSCTNLGQGCSPPWGTVSCLE